MNGAALRVGWLMYRQTQLPADLTPSQIAHAQQTYYAGASIVLRDLCNAETRFETRERLAAMNAELAHYITTLRKGKA